MYVMGAAGLWVFCPGGLGTGRAGGKRAIPGCQARAVPKFWNERAARRGLDGRNRWFAKGGRQKREQCLCARPSFALACAQRNNTSMSRQAAISLPVG